MAVTLALLRTEPYWDREVVSPELKWLGDQLCAATGRPASAVGTKGDITHLSGGHRSEEWLQRSRWCVDRAYTVQPRLTAEQLRHIAALDFTPAAWGSPDNRAKVVTLTKRYVAAGRAGRLDGVLEVIGCLNGRTAVGIEIPTGEMWPASSDHLEHVHKTFDRRRLRDRQVMERVLTAAFGEDDMEITKAEWNQAVGYDDAVPTPPNWPSDNPGMSVASALKELLLRGVEAEGMPDQVKAIQVALVSLVTLVENGGGNPDIAALVAKVDALSSAVQATRIDTKATADAVAALRADLAAVKARVAEALGGAT